MVELEWLPITAVVDEGEKKAQRERDVTCKMTSTSV